MTETTGQTQVGIGINDQQTPKQSAGPSTETNPMTLPDNARPGSISQDRQTTGDLRKPHTNYRSSPAVLAGGGPHSQCEQGGTFCSFGPDAARRECIPKVPTVPLASVRRRA